MFFMFYCKQSIVFLDKQITALCFHLHFTQRPNFFGIGIALEVSHVKDLII